MSDKYKLRKCDDNHQMDFCITKHGHTMLAIDVLKDLKRISDLEAQVKILDDKDTDNILHIQDIEARLNESEQQVTELQAIEDIVKSFVEANKVEDEVESEGTVYYSIDYDDSICVLNTPINKDKDND